MYTFSLVNGNKLRQISGVSFPISGTVAPEQQLSLEMKYESNEASDSKEDIKLIAEFQEYMTNLHLNDEAKLTSIRLEVVADADYPTNKIRHVFGPVERAEIKQFPEEPRVLCAKFFPYGGKIEDIKGRVFLTSPYAALTFDADFFVGDSRIDSFAMEFRTIEPVSLRGENARAANEAEIYLHNSQNGNIQIPDFSDGFIGVLMHIDVMVDPQYVNFEKVRIFEGYAPPINRTGWYLDYDLFPDRFLEHGIENGAVEDYVLSATRVMTGNQLDGGDIVGSWIPTSDEYYSGSYSLDIPVKWFAVGNMNQLVSQPKLLMTSTQTISVFSNGTMKVQKFGKSLQGTESSQ